MKVAEYSKSAADGVLGALGRARVGDQKTHMNLDLADNASGRAAERELTVGRDQILQTAARLRLVLGPGGHAVAVTGIESADGGTMLSARLAAAMAEIGTETVLVVDGNVAAPRLHELFSVAKAPGFLDVLEGRVDLDSAIQQREPNNLSVLPMGESERTLASLLASASCAQVFSRIRERFRYVVFDAGLIQTSPDGMLLASRSDGVVSALSVGARRQEEVVRFQEELQRLHLPLLGVVLTKAAAKKG